MLWSKLSLPALLVVAAAHSASAARFVPEPQLPIEWNTEVGFAVQSVETVKFTVLVNEQNAERVRAIAEDVSNPASHNYGKYLKQSEIDELTRPDEKHTAAVREWLQRLPGVTVKEEKDRRFVVESDVHSAARLLKTSFRKLWNGKTKQSAVRAGSYTIPDEVEGAISTIFGLHGLPLPPRKTRVLNEDAADQAAAVTPDVILKQYGVPTGRIGSGSSKNRQAVAEFQGQTMNSTDLKNFFKAYVKDAQPGDDTVSKFVGDAGDKGAQVEASLDIQFMMGVSPGIKTEFWLYNNMDFCGDLNRWSSALLKDDNVPLVHSVSYGWQGDLHFIGCKDSDISVTDDNFAKLAAKGITVIFASGDSGSGYTSKVAASEPRLWPSWPASSPYVTAVGATRFAKNKAGAAYTQEMASVAFGSGGGFSKQFSQTPNATWQAAAVAKYLSSAVTKSLPFPPRTAFPATGRATPDVSSLGEGFQTYITGRVEAVGGTSASAPLFAGLVSLLNEARLSAGKPAMGLLNPFLYQNENAFSDVVLGTNAIGRGTGPVYYGFNATAGWDPCTGLGTPKFPALKAAALAAL